MIQQMRFKNKFTYTIDAAPEVLGYASLKLMLQPLVENAIYHGMEFKDGDGIIEIKAEQKEDGLWFTVLDDGGTGRKSADGSRACFVKARLRDRR